MKVRVKRIYEKPAASDGARILIDRLWPRGVRKVDAYIDCWAKILAPSNELRKWFHEDPKARFKEFQKRYKTELQENRPAIHELMSPYKRKRYMLVTAVKDIEHSHVPTLIAFLEKMKEN